MRRIKASAAVLLAVFFAAAGSFHHHAVPKSTHDHAGLCSVATDSIELESCALCRVAQTYVQVVAEGAAEPAVDIASSLLVIATWAPAGAERSLLCDPRAPPAV